MHRVIGNICNTNNTCIYFDTLVTCAKLVTSRTNQIMEAIIAHFHQYGDHEGWRKKRHLAHAVASVFAEHERVLLVDIDPRGDVDKSDCVSHPHTLYDVLMGTARPQSAVALLSESLAIMPSQIEMAEAEIAISGRIGRERLLSRILAPLASELKRRHY